MLDCSFGGTSIGPTRGNLSSVLNPWNVLAHAGGRLLAVHELRCGYASMPMMLHESEPQGQDVHVHSQELFVFHKWCRPNV